MDRVGPKKERGENLETDSWTTYRQTRVYFFVWMYVLMILPQVHLRKPCYDFSFLEMFRFK